MIHDENVNPSSTPASPGRNENNGFCSASAHLTNDPDSTTPKSYYRKKIKFLILLIQYNGVFVQKEILRLMNNVIFFLVWLSCFCGLAPLSCVLWSTRVNQILQMLKHLTPLIRIFCRISQKPDIVSGIISASVIVLHVTDRH